MESQVRFLFVVGTIFLVAGTLFFIVRLRMLETKFQKEIFNRIVVENKKAAGQRQEKMTQGATEEKNLVGYTSSRTPSPELISKSTKDVIPKSTSSDRPIIQPGVKITPLPPLFLPPIPTQSTTTVETIATTTVLLDPNKTVPPPLPPLDEERILNAVVKIQCPTRDGLSKYVGSGFVLKDRIVVTAAHVIMDSGSQSCDIIFSRERKPIHYLKGIIDGDLKEVRRRHDEEGIDVAILILPSLDSYPEGRDIFGKYPSVPYPVCDNPKVLGDTLLHFGYPSNYQDQSYLSKLEGEAVVYADIKSIKDQLSLDGSFTFKTPIFSFTYSQLDFHPYLISRVATFYGDSGGLAFDKTKQCILGPHHGATIGGGPGENYSVFMNLGWEKMRSLLSL